MALGGADYRQAIVLALQQEGADVASSVIDLLRGIGREIDVVNTQAKEHSITGAQQVAMLAKLNAEGDKWRSVLRQVRDEEAGLTAAMEETLVPLNKLIVDSLKFADVLEKTRASTAAANDRKQQLQDEAALQDYLGQKTREAAEATVAAERAGIDARVRGTQAVNDFVAAVRASAVAEGEAQRARIDAYARQERAMEAFGAELARNVGEEKRARIDALVQAEQAQERINAQSLADQKKYHDSVIAMARAADNPLPKQFKDTQVAIAGASGALGGFATEADKSAAKSRDIGFGMMSIAYAMDDVRYGIGAVINNVPLLAQAFGASPAWAAGISIVSIAVYELGKAIAPVATQYMRDIGLMTDDTRKMVVTIDDAKAKLEAMQAKPYKVQLDYEEIARTEALIASLQERLAAFESARKGTTQQKTASEAKSVAEEYAGGSGNLMKAVAEDWAASGVSHATADQDWRQKSRTAWVRQFKAAGDQFNADRYQRQLDEVNKEIRKQSVTAAQTEVGAFLTGDPLAIQRMQGLARRRPGAFAQVGPGGVTTAEAIANLPPTAEEAQRRAAADEDAKRLDEEEKERSANYRKRLQREKAERARQAQATTNRVKVRGEFEKAIDEGEKQVARDVYVDADSQFQAEYHEAARGKRSADQAARDARNAQLTPAQVKRREEMAYGQEFQARARSNGVPVSGQEATAAGKQISGMVGSGINVNTAMEQAMANLAALVNRQQLTALQNAAAWNRINGFVEQAMLQEQFIQQQQRRMRESRKTLSLTPGS